jgi:hypothetical protein
LKKFEYQKGSEEILKRCPLREDVKRVNVASPRLLFVNCKYDKHHLPDVKGGQKKKYAEISEKR